MVYESESGVVAESRGDRRLQRRQRTRGVHRKRSDKVRFLEGRAAVLSRRARRARRNGRTEAIVLSGAAKAAHRKQASLSRRFQVSEDSQHSNGEE